MDSVHPFLSNGLCPNSRRYIEKIKIKDRTSSQKRSLQAEVMKLLQKQSGEYSEQWVVINYNELNL